MEKMNLRIFFVLWLLFAFSCGLSHASDEKQPVPQAGMEAEMRGQWKQAVEIYKSLLAKNPDRKDLWLRIADIEGFLGNTSGLAEALQEAVKLDPENAALQYRLSRAYSVINRPDSALAAIQEAVKLDANNLTYLQAQAQLASWNHRWDIAAESYDQLLSVSPDNHENQLNLAKVREWNGEFKKALEAYRLYIQKDPQNAQALDIWLKIFQLEGSLGNKPEMVLALREASQLAPNDASLQYKFSQACSVANQPEPALEAVQKAVQLEPGNIEYLKAQAQLANWNHRWDIAAESYSRIFSLNQDDSLLLNLARARVWNHETDEAIRAYEEYLKRHPDESDVLKELNSLLTGQWEKAGEVYKKLLSENPDSSDLWLKLSDVEAQSGNIQKAIDALKESVRLSPEDAPLQYRLSKAYSVTGRQDLALDAVEKAVLLDPDNLEYLRARSQLASWNGKPGIAADSCERILALTPDDDAVLLNLGMMRSWNKEFEAAARAYRLYLQKRPDDPERKAIYMRLADIEIVLSHPEGAAQAMKEALAENSNDAFLQYRLSQAYSIAEQPDPAAKAIEEAVRLDPHNVQYLMARAEIANWNGKPKISADSYARILKLSLDDDVLLLCLARARTWKGDLDGAVRTYKKYLKKYPGDWDIFMELIKVESWRGNYPVALHMLEEYKKNLGPQKEYLQEKCRILAWAGKTKKAFEIIDAVLEKDPLNYEVNLSRTVALHYGNFPRQEKESLNILKQVRPHSSETKTIEKFVMSPLRTSITPHLRYYTDSDSLDIYSGVLAAKIYMRANTHLEGEIIGDYLTADQGSGLENIDGSEDIWDSGARVGGRHRLSPKAMVYGLLGGAGVEEDEQIFSYRAGAEIQMSDPFMFKVESDRHYYVISPRAVSLGIVETKNHFQTAWELDLKNTLEMSLNYDIYSDDNERWEVLLAPRRAFLRTCRFNLDIGLSGLLFGFKDDLNNGYYDPELYEQYSVTGYAYYKINDNNGISCIVHLGAQKDENSDFRFGGSTDIEATFGFYKDWMLVLRGSVVRNVRQESGAFEGYAADISLTRRF